MTPSLPQKRRELVFDSTESKVKVAFFDADQTLRLSATDRPAPNGAGDVVLLDGTFKKLRVLAQQGFLLAIVSNQGGVKYGFLTFDDAEDAMQETIIKFAEQGIYFNYYDFADQYDSNRKPNTKMAYRLEQKLSDHNKQLLWSESFMVGDAAWKKGVDHKPDGTPGEDHSNSDRIFAEKISDKKLGFKFYHPDEFFV